MRVRARLTCIQIADVHCSLEHVRVSAIHIDTVFICLAGKLSHVMIDIHVSGVLSYARELTGISMGKERAGSPVNPRQDAVLIAYHCSVHMPCW